MGEVVARVQLEDEDVINAGRPPAVRVDTDEERAEEDEEDAAIHLQGRPPVESVVRVEPCNRPRSNTVPERASV